MHTQTLPVHEPLPPTLTLCSPSFLLPFVPRRCKATRICDLCGHAIGGGAQNGLETFLLASLLRILVMSLLDKHWVANERWLSARDV